MKSAVCLLAITMMGCGGELLDEGGDIAVEDESLIAQNGISLNGISLNGISLNGISLNGISLNGISLNGISLNGISLNGISLNGTNLTGTKAGVPVSGAGFVGSLLTGTLSNGSTLSLRIDDAAALTAPNADVWTYGVSYKNSAPGVNPATWVPLCGSSAIKAVAVYGTFNMGQGVTGGGSYTYDSSKITFGCRGTAIAKCIEIGYKPWQTVTGTLMRNHFAACTRMIRADYCGDGKAYTVNGTPINVYDGKNIQVDTAAWPNDAEWTASGARCVGQSTPPRIQLSHHQVPWCFTSRISPTCGLVPATAYLAGSLLIEETQ